MRTVGCLVIVVLYLVAGLDAQAPARPADSLVVQPSLGPRTVVPALVACADVPTITQPAATLRIVAPHAGDFHKNAGRGELVVLNGGTPMGYAVGQRYFVRRLRMPTYRQPMTADRPGSIRTAGWLTVVGTDERTALARIDYACVPIEAGDFLEPYAEPVLPASLAEAGPPNFDDLGRVLFGVDRRESVGAGDFLSIDRGGSKGIVTGSRIAFYRDRGDGTPLVEIGSGIVIEVATETAKVVVDRAYGDVKSGDYYTVLGTPRH